MEETILTRRILPSDEEATEMTRIQLESFAGQAIRSVFFPKGRDSEHEEFAYRKSQIVWGAREPEKHWIVAFSETTSAEGVKKEKMIGYCLWVTPVLPGQGKSDEEKAREKQVALSSRPDSMDKGANDRFMVEHERLYKQSMGITPEDYWSLNALCVHPKHRRKGAAAMMLKWGLDQVVRQGKGAVVGSTPVARPFYESMGFEVIAETRLGDETHFMMKTHPSVIAAGSF